MMFSCLPVGNEHECCIVLHFLSQYNELNGTSYRVADFPELRNRNTKEPEALLEAPGRGLRLAIERKSIVHTLDRRYMPNHRNGHHLFDCFQKKLKSRGCDYSDSLYMLTVYDRDLKEKRQREVPEIAEQIASVVARDWSKIDEFRYGIGGKSPIQWEFRVVPSKERDYGDPESGMGFTVMEENELFGPPEMVDDEVWGYSKEFELQAARAAEKFVRYADHRRLLLVQFFGHTLGEVGDEEIVEMIESASLPKAIDEVWVCARGMGGSA